MKKNESKTVSVVTTLAQPIAEALGLTIWDIRFEKEGATWMLRVILDKEGGVSIDDCEAMSRPLDKKLDETDPIEQSYCLSVESAGLERELTRDWHFDCCKGKEVSVRLIRPCEGEREFRGTLLALADGEVSIQSGENQRAFPLSDIAYVRLYADIL